MAFQGFAAVTDEGTPCYVINANPDTKKYRVTLGTYGGWVGDHTVYRVVHYTGATGWIDMSKVTRTRKHRRVCTRLDNGGSQKY